MVGWHANVCYHPVMVELFNVSNATMCGTLTLKSASQDGHCNVAKFHHVWWTLKLRLKSSLEKWFHSLCLTLCLPCTPSPSPSSGPHPNTQLHLHARTHARTHASRQRQDEHASRCTTAHKKNAGMYTICKRSAEVMHSGTRMAKPMAAVDDDDEGQARGRGRVCTCAAER